MSRSSKSAGKTAVAHARAWVAERYPCAGILEASKKVGRFPGQKARDGTVLEWVNRTVSEDIFGVFDLCVFPFERSESGKYLVDLIQVTTIGQREPGTDHLSKIRERQSKVGRFARTRLNAECPDWLGALYVVGWVQRKHLRIWRWSWERSDAHHVGRWQEDKPVLAKLPKLARSSRGVLGSTSSLGQMPF